MVKIQCLKAFDSDTCRKLHFAGIKGCKAVLQWKSCRIDQFCNPCGFAVLYFILQKIIQVFLMALAGLDHRIFYKIY